MKRLAFSSDLHGDKEKFQKFFNVRADYHVIGGDLLPKRGTLKTIYKKQRSFMAEFLNPFLEQKKDVTTTLLMLGNDDLEPFEQVLLDFEREGLCKQLHGNRFTIEGFELIGFKYIPPTPFSLKGIERRDSRGVIDPLHRLYSSFIFEDDGSPIKIDFQAYLKSQPSIAELLETLPKPADYSKSIYAMHSPPYDCGIDVTVRGDPVGSIDIKNFLLQYQPALFLCGHIHESPGTFHLGKTPCINPGQLHEFAYSLFELDNDTIRFLKIPPALNEKT